MELTNLYLAPFLSLKNVLSGSKRTNLIILVRKPVSTSADVKPDLPDIILVVWYLSLLVWDFKRPDPNTWCRVNVSIMSNCSRCCERDEVNFYLILEGGGGKQNKMILNECTKKSLNKD